MDIPSDIEVTIDGRTAGTLTFVGFVRYLLDGDSRANASGAAIRAAARIENQIADCQAKGLGIKLEVGDAKLLAEIADAPEHGYPFVVLQQGEERVKRPIARQLAPFIAWCVEAGARADVAPAAPAPAQPTAHTNGAAARA